MLKQFRSQKNDEQHYLKKKLQVIKKKLFGHPVFLKLI